MIRLATIFVLLTGTFLGAAAQPEGAWTASDGAEQTTYIFAGKYFAATRYSVADKKFTGTWGGSFRSEKGQLILNQEFNTLEPEKIGAEIILDSKLSKNKWSIGVAGGPKTEFTRVDDGKPGALSGAWLITGRMVNGKATQNTPGVRRTMKILSGTRFQWIAYNVETKEFFGTGGGTYTTIDGKYTENIEFFSRDNSRVGASLNFDFSIEEGRWRHKGMSSKGELIDEYWSKRESLGI
jgi:hypothetical protein